jgi:hypothetical protein
VSAGQTLDLSWTELQAAGVGLETLTIRAIGSTICDNDVDFAALTIVPEPATLSLLGLGAVALLRRRS